MRVGVLLLVAVTGCSFIQVRGTPRTPTSPYETACASYEPPIADPLLGAAAMGTAVYTSTRCTPNGLDCLGDGMTAGMLVSSGIILAASATYGYIQKARCERARPPAAYDAAVARSSDSSE